MPGVQVLNAPDGPPPPPPAPNRPPGMPPPGAGLGRPQPGQGFPQQGMGMGPPPMDQRMMQAQQMQMQMQMPMMPPPGRELIPPGLRQRQNVEVIDLRKERVTEKEMRDALSDFFIYRFEKVLDDEGYDLEGYKINSSWSNVHRTLVTDVSRPDAFRQVAALTRMTPGVVAKKKALNADQQRQLEKGLEDLMRNEHEPQLFQYELAQIDEQLKLLDPNMVTGVYRKHSSHHHHHHRHHRHHRHHKSHSTKVVYKSDRKNKKRVWQRISLTAYYKRVPRPDANIFAMYDERERRKHIAPRLHQELLAREHMEREQAFARQQMHLAMTQGGGMPPGPFGGQGGGFGPSGPQGAPNRPPPQVIPMNGKGDGKNNRNRRHSDSESGSSYSNSESFWSDDDASRDTGGTSHTSSHSHGDHRRRKPKRYIEAPGPAYYGVGKPHVTRRHSRDAQGLPPLVPAAPVAILPPAAADVDTIKAHAYEIGVADGRFEERRENLADDVARERERLREERERLREERELAVLEREERHEREMRAARRQRRLTAPPPRIHQEMPWAARDIARQIGVRPVTESEVDRQVEADEFLDRLRRLRVRSPSEDEYTDDLRMPPSPRRASRYEPRTMSIEEDLLNEDEYRTGRRIGDAVGYMRRRASSPGVSPVGGGNPFRPRRRAGEFFDDRFGH